MGPWSAEAIEWDEGNESELNAHAISAQDVEDVYGDGPLWVPNKKFRPGQWKMIGCNRGGRFLTIVIQWDEVRLSIRPITGWDTSPGERTKYLT